MKELNDRESVMVTGGAEVGSEEEIIEQQGVVIGVLQSNKYEVKLVGSGDIIECDLGAQIITECTHVAIGHIVIVEMSEKDMTRGTIIAQIH